MTAGRQAAVVVAVAVAAVLSASPGPMRPGAGRAVPIACPRAGPLDTVHASIGPRGGRFDAGDGGMIEVPRGGVPQDRRFTIHRASAERMVVEITADGPIDSVYLTLSFAGCPPRGNPADLFIARMESDTLGVRLDGTVSPRDRTVTVRLDHLSPYAIATH
jgi:hypothetical protein